MKKIDNKAIALLSVVIVGLAILASFKAQSNKINVVFPSGNGEISEISFIGGNSVLVVSNPYLPEAPAIQRINMLITAYSSTPWETWGDPFITASGARVRDGIVANNMLPFGTKIRLPEIYGDKVFEVKDRLHSRKGPHQIDIWFPEHQQAVNFGIARTYVEILAD